MFAILPTMAMLPIITGADHPALRAKAKKVPRVTKEIRALARDMEETVQAANGIGLAAPQVDRSVRLCLVTIGGKIVPLVNPEIIHRSEQEDEAEEGCLSLPDVWLTIRRPVAIVVRYTDLQGAEQERALTGLDARVVQHEVDHLDGILIVDYAPNAKVM